MRSFSDMSSLCWSTFRRNTAISSLHFRRFSDSIRDISSFSLRVSVIASSRCAFCPCVLYTVASSSRSDDICDSRDVMYAALTGLLLWNMRR